MLRSSLDSPERALELLVRVPIRHPDAISSCQPRIDPEYTEKNTLDTGVEVEATASRPL
jgi:hypothetical protein